MPVGGYMYRQDQRWHGVRGIWGEGLPIGGTPPTSCQGMLAYIRHEDLEDHPTMYDQYV
jgi:hypothetical protein